MDSHKRSKNDNLMTCRSGISVAEMYNMRGYDRGAWAKSLEAFVNKKVVEQVLKYYIRHVERMNEHDEKRVERAYESEHDKYQ